jgi:type I site-specific restriction-modification system R (restriction) subunit|tara:strand:- start:156 stop:611 length:456 start_codon:yes stop_codon:yes gene_type:complete
MLAEIAMANAAFGVIKSAIQNGRELAQCGKSISDFLSAEDSLKNKTEVDKNSIFKKVMGKDTNDFESFLALDKIKEQRRQLESHMRLYGRPGLYDSWVEYQGQVRKARKEAEKQQKKDREELVEAISIFVGVVIFIALAIGGIYLLYTYKM